MLGKKKSGIIFAAIAGIFWGTVGLFTRYLYAEGFTNYQVSMFRVFFAALILTSIILIRNPSSMKLKSIKHIGIFFISGTAGMAMCYAAYFATIKISTLSIAVVMMYSAPIMVTIMAAVIFKEKITTIKLISIIMAFSGCIIMSGILGGSDIKLTYLGVLIGFLSGFGYALNCIGTKLALSHYGTTTVSAYTIIFAVIGLIPFTPVGKTVSMLAANPKALIVAIGLGIFGTLIPSTLYILAQNYAEISKVAVVGLLEPISATIIGTIIFKEAITVNTVVAMILIIMSVIIVNLNIFKKKKKKIVSDKNIA